jgi:acyl-CoA synthetase (AMP-forming)/AMP-acid ligase II
MTLPREHRLDNDVITPDEFRQELRAKLVANRNKVLLRVVVSPGFDRPLEFTGEDLLRKAEELVTGLNLGRERSVVLILLPHSPEIFLLQLGLVLKGHVPAILPWPTSRIDAEKYQRNLVHQLSHLPANLLITLSRLAENLEESLPYQVRGLTLENARVFEKLFPADPVSAEIKDAESFESQVRTNPDPEILFLQFSGGTTGSQKAIAVTGAMLKDQLTHLGEALQFTPEDGVASWLPLYHDMGLIACYWLPLWYGAASLQMAADDWVINPELLLRYLQRYGATFCWLPNFSFSYLSQRREQMQNRYCLGGVRGWINCSEPIREKSVEEFVDAFSDWGVAKQRVLSSYAMAETTFAVTQSDPGREPQTFLRNRLAQDHKGYVTRAFELIDDKYVSSGKAIPGAKIKIAAEDGAPCPDGVAGEILVMTPGLFRGYWGLGGFQTHSLSEGWHSTGDYGFIVDGELFVIGRFKDIVIVGGNNIFPEDVEAIVNTVEGIHPGRVVAFGVEDSELGTQSLAVVAEMDGEFHQAKAAELESVIRKLVLTTIGTASRYVSVVPPRWIVKSTAGKISRKETRERFLREKLIAVRNEVASDSRK